MSQPSNSAITPGMPVISGDQLSVRARAEEEVRAQRKERYCVARRSS
jgi:hypothetical protein